jgi:hypothetical protein
MYGNVDRLYACACCMLCVHSWHFDFYMYMHVLGLVYAYVLATLASKNNYAAQVCRIIFFMSSSCILNHSDFHFCM